mmetsp:Transcript_43981/g.124504  ORF Transcript_43981/g.124504 Transcript_43981/m.124504 type:complete len:158 (-) Transcript_43981:29-502(-)
MRLVSAVLCCPFPVGVIPLSVPICALFSPPIGTALVTHSGKAGQRSLLMENLKEKTGMKTHIISAATRAPDSDSCLRVSLPCPSIIYNGAALRANDLNGKTASAQHDTHVENRTRQRGRQRGRSTPRNDEGHSPGSCATCPREDELVQEKSVETGVL